MDNTNAQKLKLKLVDFTAMAVRDCLSEGKPLKEMLAEYIGDNTYLTAWPDGIHLNDGSGISFKYSYETVFDCDVPTCDCEAKILDETILSLKKQLNKLNNIRSQYTTGNKCKYCEENK